jgi:hypothetical protein
MHQNLTLEPDSTALERASHVCRRHSHIWVALVLWVASNLFVTGVAKVATWEGLASYHRAADFCKWDCGWYASVLETGYYRTTRNDTAETNWPFHPLFPLTAYPFRHWLKFGISFSLVLASKLELLLAIYAFLWMTSDQVKSTNDSFRAGSLVAFNPYVIYAHAGYAEPLYFGVLALAFYFANRRRWIASGLMGALVSATRVIGFLFPIPYMIIWLRDVNWRPHWRRLDVDKVIGLLLCPLGTALFMLYLYKHTGDALAQVHAHAAWGKSVGNPFHVLWLCLIEHHWPRVWGAMAIAEMVASVYLFKLKKPALGAFLGISVLLSISGGSLAIARYIWWQPPFMYAIYRLLKRHAGGWLIYTAFAAGMAAFMVLGWFSGHNFVV